jgi:hypothetical protein
MTFVAFHPLWEPGRCVVRLPSALREVVDFLQPKSWKSAEHPDAPGEITRVASNPEPLAEGKNPQPSASINELLIARDVLIVKQTQGAHDELRELIQRIEQGDPDPTAGMGGMGGGGGFGGGFFNAPSQKPNK